MKTKKSFNRSSTAINRKIIIKLYRIIKKKKHVQSRKSQKPKNLGIEFAPLLINKSNFERK